MRKPLIAGNWKMHKTEAEAISLVRKLIHGLKSQTAVDVLLCPPFTSLSQLHKLLISSPIFLGAQNISEQKEGAYTGEISAEMAAEFCSYVLLGHSERRAIFYESADLINQKIQSALSVDLIPVLCVGELLEERESGQAANVISRQLHASLNGVHLPDPEKLVIAYEPIWAIGSGKSASANDTGNLIGGVIRPTLAGIWDEDTSQKIRVLYGGSVNSGNARGFFSQSEIDGALVGGASLSVNNFLGIIEEAK